MSELNLYELICTQEQGCIKTEKEWMSCVMFSLDMVEMEARKFINDGLELGYFQSDVDSFGNFGLRVNPRWYVEHLRIQIEMQDDE